MQRVTYKQRHYLVNQYGAVMLDTSKEKPRSKQTLNVPGYHEWETDELYPRGEAAEEIRRLADAQTKP